MTEINKVDVKCANVRCCDWLLHRPLRRPLCVECFTQEVSFSDDSREVEVEVVF